MRAIHYESPSWLSEFVSGAGVLGWSIGMMCGDDYRWTQGSYILPIVGLLSGPMRLVSLLSPVSYYRTAFAILHALCWLQLAELLWDRTGSTGAVLVYSVIALCDALIVVKFSTMAYVRTKAEANSDG